jgi:hypothetical protein
MAERGAGQRSWPLSPYEVNVSFARTNAAGEGANWFGPLTPITPLAPPEIAGRQWDYPAGYNLSTLSRPFEPITFSTLRALADGYDLFAACHRDPKGPGRAANLDHRRAG